MNALPRFPCWLGGGGVYRVVTGMGRFLKRLLLFVGLPLALAVALVAGFGWLALRQFTPDNVVRELEALCNARVQLEGCSLSLFSSPAKLELNGLQFHPRDAEADGATPPATRPPIKITNTYLRMRRGVVEADLAALLLRREVRVRSLHVEMGDVKCDILPSGGNSLRALFRSPATVGGKPNPALAALAVSAAAVAEAATAATNPSTAPSTSADGNAEATADEEDLADNGPIPEFHARELRGAIAIDRISFVDGRIRARNRKSRAVTELNQMHLEVTGLEVDPARLDQVNRGTVGFRSRVWIDGGRKNPGRVAELQIGVRGTVTPFDAATGVLQPDFVFTTDVARGATLRSLPALEKIEKNLARARRAGLKFDAFATAPVLAEDVTLHFRLRENSLALTQPARLDFTDYALALDSGSALDLATDTHRLKASWIASQAISDRALGGAQDFLASLGEDAAAELRRLLIDPLVRDGRLHMEFTSRGDLAKPDVRVAHPLQDVTDQLKDAGRGLLDNFKNN